jgi:carboxypeptidase Taq
LGAIYACQFYQAAQTQKVDVTDFKLLREWLRERIHAKGSLLGSGTALAKEVSGKALDVEGFLGYLREKYGRLY